MDHFFNLSHDPIISIGVEKRDNHYSFGKHLHDTYEVYRILEGQCYMDIGHQTICCSQGDFVLILPYTVHSFYLKADCTCRFQHLHFEGDNFKPLLYHPYPNHPQDGAISLLESLHLQKGGFFSLKNHEKINAIIQSILDYYQLGESVYIELINISLSHLIVLLAEIMEKEELCSDKNHTGNRYVLFALNYIRENYNKKILISDIAGLLNISSRYLSKVFHEHVHMTISTYLNTYRINEAIHLMRHTTLSLTEISYHIGLKDSQHFTKLFHNIMGITPHKYRKLIRKNPYLVADPSFIIKEPEPLV